MIFTLTISGLYKPCANNLEKWKELRTKGRDHVLVKIKSNEKASQLKYEKTTSLSYYKKTFKE